MVRPLLDAEAGIFRGIDSPCFVNTPAARTPVNVPFLDTDERYRTSQDAARRAVPGLGSGARRRATTCSAALDALQQLLTRKRVGAPHDPHGSPGQARAGRVDRATLLLRLRNADRAR